MQNLYDLKLKPYIFNMAHLKYKLILSIVLSFAVNALFSQTFYPYKDIKLEKAADYTATEPLALSAANFILGNPFVEGDENRSAALQFLSSWVIGTSDHSFYMKGKVAEINSDVYVLSLFVAAMVKFTLENKTEAVNPINVDVNAAKIVLAYCNDKNNNFKLKRKSRKVLEGN